MYLHALIISCLVSQSYQTTETKLIQHLLDTTSKYARPAVNSSTPVVVTLGFELIHLVAVVESEQTLKLKVWLRMQWTNAYMKWDPEKWGKVVRTRLDYDNVWTPDIFIKEDVGEEISSGPEKYKTPVSCEYDGTHRWMVPALLHSSCIFDVNDFPYDRQKCYLKFISWSHDQSELDIIVDPRDIVTSNYINSAEWDLVDVVSERNIAKYNCCPNPFVDILYKITIDRRAMYYIFNAVVPCLIQMIIILFTFFLPPDSGERIGVVITVLLVFAVYLEIISSNLPRTSSSVPALSLFYISAMAASSCSLIATCFVLVVHFKGTEKGVTPMPLWLKRIFLDLVGRLLGIRKNLREHKNEGLLALEQNGNHADARLDDNVKFDNKAYTTDQLPPPPDRAMATLVEEVRVITQLIHDQNRQDEIEEEWQTLAKVLDRMFFFVFLLIFLILTLAILLPVYIHYKSEH